MYVNYFVCMLFVCVNNAKYRLLLGLDIFYPIFYSMTIVDSLFRILTESEDFKRVIKKYPLHIARGIIHFIFVYE